MEKWYAVQVRTGKEEDTAVLCRKIIDRKLLYECFIPRYERMKRYLGEWHKEQLPLFPGYLFFATGQIDELHQELKQVPELTKILGDGTIPVPLKDEEVGLLRQLGGERHVARMSEGYMAGERVVITSGSLKKIQGNIKKIDRHKRLAVVEVEMFGRQLEVKVGLEIVEKF